MSPSGIQTLASDLWSYSTILELGCKVCSFPVPEAVGGFAAAASGAHPNMTYGQGHRVWWGVADDDNFLLYIHGTGVFLCKLHQPSEQSTQAIPPGSVSLTTLHTVKVQSTVLIFLLSQCLFGDYGQCSGCRWVDEAVEWFSIQVAAKARWRLQPSSTIGLEYILHLMQLLPMMLQIHPAPALLQVVVLGGAGWGSSTCVLQSSDPYLIISLSEISIHSAEGYHPQQLCCTTGRPAHRTSTGANAETQNHKIKGMKYLNFSKRTHCGTHSLQDPDPKSLPTQVNATATATNSKWKEVVQLSIDDGSTTAGWLGLFQWSIVHCLVSFQFGCIINPWTLKKTLTLTCPQTLAILILNPCPSRGRQHRVRGCINSESKLNKLDHGHPHNPPPQSHDAQQSPVPMSTTSQAICDGNCDCALLTGSELDRGVELDDKNIKVSDIKHFF
ncbi:hypothetical protein EDC04DRAFT_2610311 [Pisolithus marmoratus]|nr:hypothetical protein EDC04DRAFT_2610311 [Pisolithus marmoratus]